MSGLGWLDGDSTDFVVPSGASWVLFVFFTQLLNDLAQTQKDCRDLQREAIQLLARKGKEEYIFISCFAPASEIAVVLTEVARRHDIFQNQKQSHIFKD